MGKLSIKIYDTSGRLLQYFQRQASVGQQMITIDVSSLSKGSYQVEISHGVQVGVQKFIVP